jgi:hypothetical protein
MIQSTGIIIAQDGITQYKNQKITVYMVSPSKFSPTIGIAQVGIYTETSFNPIALVGSYNHEGVNPSFEEVQATVLAGLQTDYPSVTFQIV